jgi:DUF971 family protein
MQPTRFEVVGDFLAIAWPDGQESVIELKVLRENCPCARCAGETDLTGHVHKGPSAPLRPESFQVLTFERVGNYAVAPRWADGHDTGIYTFEALRRLGAGPQ